MRGTGLLSMWIRSALTGPLFFAIFYLIIVALTVWLLRKKTASVTRTMWVALALASLFLLFCLPYPAFLLQHPLRHWAHGLIEKNAPILAVDVEHSPRTAIVVLGGGFLPQGVPSWISLQRLERALEIQRHLPQSILIVSDSTIRHYKAEEHLLQYLHNSNVPLHQVRLEAAADNTRENVCHIRNLIMDEHFEQVILVTSLTHIPRAFLTARKCGMRTTLAAPAEAQRDLVFCPTWHSLIHFSRLMNEYAGLAGYKLAGWL